MTNNNLATFLLELLILGVVVSILLTMRAAPALSPVAKRVPIPVSLTHEETMPSRTTEWTSALGREKVTTTKGEINPAETAGEWATRHRAEVVAAQLLDPPV
jgi:hypothetical protein